MAIATRSAWGQLAMAVEGRAGSMPFRQPRELYDRKKSVMIRFKTMYAASSRRHQLALTAKAWSRMPLCGPLGGEACVDRLSRQIAANSMLASSFAMASQIALDDCRLVILGGQALIVPPERETSAGLDGRDYDA